MCCLNEMEVLYVMPCELQMCACVWGVKLLFTVSGGEAMVLVIITFEKSAYLFVKRYVNFFVVQKA